jgi:HD-like signal output (HDOD) protein
MSDIAEKVLLAITKSIQNDQMVLPTLPEVALQVRDAAEDENADIPMLCRVLQNDTALSARIIKVTNSPLMRTNQTITDLRTAVSRLGIRYTSNLAMGLAMEQMFQATNDTIDALLRDNWQRSTEVAGICHVLCRHYTKLAPDQATLAGLVHRIGALPLLTFAENHSALQKPELLRALIEKLAHTLGTLILKHWDFPADLQVVPENSLDFSRQIDRADYADLVTVAMLQTAAKHGTTYGDVATQNVTAFQRLGINPDSDILADEDLSEDMEAAMAYLD